MDSDPIALIRGCIAVGLFVTAKPLWRVWRRWRLERASKSWPEIPAEIVDVEIQLLDDFFYRARHSIFANYRYRVKFFCRYQVGSQKFTAEEWLPVEFREEYAEREAAALRARGVQIAYNPQKPSQAMVLPRQPAKALWQFLGIAALWITAVAILVIQLQQDKAS